VQVAEGGDWLLPQVCFARTPALFLSAVAVQVISDQTEVQAHHQCAQTCFLGTTAGRPVTADRAPGVRPCDYAGDYAHNTRYLGIAFQIIRSGNLPALTGLLRMAAPLCQISTGPERHWQR
jgi:hypothetical protein